VELNPQERSPSASAPQGRDWGLLHPDRCGTKIAEARRAGSSTARDDLRKPLRADFAIVRAWKGDKWGNLHSADRTQLQPMMCTAARVTIAEVEHLVEVGDLDGDQIHVRRLREAHLQGGNYQKWIEKRTVRSA